MALPLLEAHNVSCGKGQSQLIFDNVDLTVNEGDVIVIQGKSGSGKTTLLECIAHLNSYNGQILYRGRTPKSYGIPLYRTRVSYVPQRPSLLPGSPRDFLLTVLSFSARKGYANDEGGTSVALERSMKVATAFGIESLLWDRGWSNLSGGEAQRIAMAVAIGLNTAEILLLDEPTSALDSQSSSLVEKYLADELHSAESTLKAILWITHSEEQGIRVGNRFIQISAGRCIEHPTPAV